MKTIEVPQADARFAALLTELADDRAGLATIRRAVGKSVDDAIDVWPYVASIVSEGDRRFDAFCRAVVLFALHQQSQLQVMHVAGQSLGKAVAELRARRPESAGIERRFLAALSADSADALTAHLRGLIRMLRNEGIALDYVDLARGLWAWDDPDRRSRIRRSWGLAFYWANPEAGDAGKGSDGEADVVSDIEED